MSSGLQRRTDTCEVVQPLVGTVGLALGPGDAVCHAEQDLVERVPQLRRRPTLLTGGREPRPRADGH